MYKYLENLSIRSIIVLAVILSSFIIFSITIAYLGSNVRQLTLQDSKVIVYQYANGNAIQIQGLCNEVMTLTRTLADAIYENKEWAAQEHSQGQSGRVA